VTLIGLDFRTAPEWVMPAGVNDLACVNAWRGWLHLVTVTELTLTVAAGRLGRRRVHAHRSDA
jgi:hypothetical protein